MAKVRVFGVPGIEMWFYSGDHEPAHLHARSPGEWDASVYILAPRKDMIKLIRPPDGRIGRTDRKRIVEGVENHRAELLAEWEACQTA